MARAELLDQIEQLNGAGFATCTKSRTAFVVGANACRHPLYLFKAKCDDLLDELPGDLLRT
jgi:hypothetical protein